MNIYGKVSGGVPPLMYLDPQATVACGIVIKLDNGAVGEISQVQRVDGAYWINVRWLNLDTAPKGNTADGGEMILEAFIVTGPRPPLTPHPRMTTAELMQATECAYSRASYSEINWEACIVMLRERGHTDQEIQAVMRSKWTRWAGDVADTPTGLHTAADLKRFLDDPRNKCTAGAIKSLADGIFSGEGK